MIKDFCELMFELGMLRRVKRQGWRLIGVDNPESVAEHSLRAAQIGFLLAELEGYEKPEKVAAMMIFHDISECRTGDIHKVANRYLSYDENDVIKKQVKPLQTTGEKILSLFNEYDQGNSEAAKIARDADLIELAVTAREYQEKGYKTAGKWIENVYKRIKTENGRKIIEKIMGLKPYDWWKGLKKI